ncbi:MAG TPA: DUF4352 domain-containing protein, partial [Candidatus Saccharimonadales bacterium]
MTDRQKQRNWFARHKILTGIAAFIVLIAIVGATSGGDTKKTENNGGGTKTATSQATTAKIGEPARDGKFEFTISAVKCGETTIGTNEYLQEKAQGQFCRVS